MRPTQLYVLGAVAIFVLLAWCSTRSGSCMDRTGRGLEAAFEDAWELLAEERAKSGQPLRASRLLRSQSGVVLAQRLERIARGAVDGAEWAEPSRGEARRWLGEFVAVFESAYASGLADQPLELLLMEAGPGDEWRLWVSEGTSSFALRVLVTCEDDRPVRLAARDG